MNKNNSLVITYNEKIDSGGSFPLIKTGEQANIKVLLSPLFNQQESIDVTIHEFLKEKLLNENFDKIFIPISISEDYLNFTGIYFGLHLRFSLFLNRMKNVPIIFYADKEETKEFISSYSNLGYFLFTKGVYLIEESKEEIIRYSTKELEFVSNDYIKNTLPSKIILTPPAFYDNRHSIANEWALLLLDSISGHNILKEKPELQEIQSNLYVKSLMVKNGIDMPINNSSTKPYQIPNTKGKRILLIDDEWNKGWLELFRAFLGHKEDDTIVDYIHIEKNSTEDEINKALEEKLQEEWDLFLLDIRLLDDDHRKDKYYFDYTGFNVLDLIMESNGGNQVLLMSASNKHQLYKHGLDGEESASESFMKPGPETSVTLNDLQHLLILPISRCLKKGSLKTYYKQIDEIKNLSNNYFFDKTDRIQEFIFDCNYILDIGFELLGKAYQKKEFLRYTYIQLFTIIEYFVQFEKNFKVDLNAFVIVDNTTEVCILKPKNNKTYESALLWKGLWEERFYKPSRSTFSRRIDTNFKMSSLLIFKYGLSTSRKENWKKINAVRNKCAHMDFQPTLNDIEDLIRFLKFIFNKKNINKKNIEKGLTIPTFEDSMNRLKKNWGT